MSVRAVSRVVCRVVSIFCFLVLPLALRAAAWSDPLGDWALSDAFLDRWQAAEGVAPRVEAFVEAYSESWPELRREREFHPYVEKGQGDDGSAARLTVVESRTNGYLLRFIGRFFPFLAQAAVVEDGDMETAERDMKRRLCELAPSMRWMNLKLRAYAWKGTREKMRGAWILYANPRAGRAFGHRLGHLVLFWIEMPESRGKEAFDGALLDLARSLHLTEQTCDVFEKGGWILPVSSLALAPWEMDEDYPSARATAKANFAGSFALVHLIKNRAAIWRRNALDRHSFPSGHTASALTAAGAIGHIHPDSRLPLLALGAMVGRSRIRSHHHRPVDVVVGGMIGYYAGRYFARQEMEHRARPSMFLAPLTSLRF